MSKSFFSARFLPPCSRMNGYRLDMTTLLLPSAQSTASRNGRMMSMASDFK
ncbi:MAG: hypothetical protein HQL61_03285 [Magnetococcales bacterium]|nr:hypothetical protein [Nitrospirota bacterium]